MVRIIFKPQFTFDFQSDFLQSKKGENFYKLVRDGQNPETLFIACSDSRIDPAILTQSDPGEFFSIRNVAAFVPPYKNEGFLNGTSSAIEYAVRFLKVKHIVVMGHADCGGIQALATDNFELEGEDDFEFLQEWLKLGKAAQSAIWDNINSQNNERKIRTLEQASILISLLNLLTYPWIKSKYDNNDLQIHGWYFEMAKGQLLEYCFEQNQFEEIKENRPHENLFIQPSLSNFLKINSCAC